MREDRMIIYHGEDMAVKYFAKKVVEDLEFKDDEIEELKEELDKVKRERDELFHACWKAGEEKRELEEALREAKRVAYEMGIERDAYANTLKKTQERCDEIEMEVRSLWNRFSPVRSEAENE